MHLVFLNQYYPPDAAPTGVMLEAVVEELARQGHAVTVICAAGGYADAEKLKTEKLKAEMERGFQSALPSYPQPSALNPQLSSPNTSALGGQVGGPGGPALPVNIVRIGATSFGRGTFVGKLMDYASYYLGVAWRLMMLHPRPDRIIALTTPPYLSVLARMASKFQGADHAHWVMDLYPDVMAAHGMLGEKSWVYRILAGVARWGFGGRRCAAVLTLGPDMAERVGRLVGTSNIERQTSNIDPSSPGGCAGTRHRTSDIEHRREEGADSAIADTSQGRMNESRDESRGPDLPTDSPDTSSSSNDQPFIPAKPRGDGGSTFNSQLSSVQWVPLWGGERGNIDPSSPVGCAGTRYRTSDIERRREEGADSAIADSTQGRMNESRDESRGPYLRTDSPDASSSSNDQPFIPAKPRGDAGSTLNSQLSSAWRRKRGWGDDELVVMYSGNMGLGHRFGEILEAVGLIAEWGVRNAECGGDEDSGASQQRGMNESRDPASPVSCAGTRESCGPEMAKDPSYSQLFIPAKPRGDAGSTINSQLSSMGSSMGNSALGGQVGGPGGPALPSSSTRFVFYGGGKRRGEVETFLKEHPELPVELHDYAPAEELAAHLQSADVHLASLDPAWTGTMVPSKLQGIFAAGRPVIFIGSGDSSIGRWVAESGGGWVISAGDVEGLVAAFDEALDSAVRERRGRAARVFGERHFDKRTNVARVAEILSR